MPGIRDEIPGFFRFAIAAFSGCRGQAFAFLLQGIYVGTLPASSTLNCASDTQQRPIRPAHEGAALHNRLGPHHYRGSSRGRLHGQVARLH